MFCTFARFCFCFVFLLIFRQNAVWECPFKDHNKEVWRKQYFSSWSSRRRPALISGWYCTTRGTAEKPQSISDGSQKVNHHRCWHSVGWSHADRSQFPCKTIKWICKHVVITEFLRLKNSIFNCLEPASKENRCVCVRSRADVDDKFVYSVNIVHLVM